MRNEAGNETVAISTHDHKLASIFFDSIFPLSNGGSVPSQIRYTNRWLADEALAQAVVKTLRSSPSGDTDEFFRGMFNTMAYEYHKRLTAKGIRSVPLYQGQVAHEQLPASGAEEAIEIRLCNLPIVNTSTLEWEHILDLRANPDFKKKLRRLRLFLSDNYKGKDEHYIKDSLLQKLDDYEDACKRHGLQLTTSTLSQVLNSKSLLGTLGISAAAILTGNTALATASALTGSVIELGKLAIHIAERRSSITYEKEHSEISYLIDIQKLAEKPKSTPRRKPIKLIDNEGTPIKDRNGKTVMVGSRVRVPNPALMGDNEGEVEGYDGLFINIRTDDGGLIAMQLSSDWAKGLEILDGDISIIK